MGAAISLVLVGLASVPITARFKAPRNVVRGSAGYWLSSVAPIVGQLDVVVARAIAGASMAGFYAAANRIIGPLNVVTNALLNVFLPRFSQ